MKKYLLLWLAGLSLTVFIGCESTPVYKSLDETPPPAVWPGLATTRADLLQPPTELFTLGPGDRVEIEIIGTLTSRTSATVGPDGRSPGHDLRKRPLTPSASP